MIETARSRSPSDIFVVAAVVFACYSQVLHTTATGKSFGRVDLSFSSLSPSGGVSVFSSVSCRGLPLDGVAFFTAGLTIKGLHFH